MTVAAYLAERQQARQQEANEVLEYLAARGAARKKEANELLAKNDRKEGARHTRAAVLLVEAQVTLAIRYELARGAHHHKGKNRKPSAANKRDMIARACTCPLPRAPEDGCEHRKGILRCAGAIEEMQRIKSEYGGR